MTLKEFITVKGSTAKAAKELGIPYLTIHRWIKGKSKPSPAMRLILTMNGITR